MSAALEAAGHSQALLLSSCSSAKLWDSQHLRIFKTANGLASCCAALGGSVSRPAQSFPDIVQHADAAAHTELSFISRRTTGAHLAWPRAPRAQACAPTGILRQSRSAYTHPFSHHSMRGSKRKYHLASLKVSMLYGEQSVACIAWVCRSGGAKVREQAGKDERILAGTMMGRQLQSTAYMGLSSSE